jgi:hypothetical protein
MSSPRLPSLTPQSKKPEAELLPQSGKDQDPVRAGEDDPVHRRTMSLGVDRRNPQFNLL